MLIKTSFVCLTLRPSLTRLDCFVLFCFFHHAKKKTKKKKHLLTAPLELRAGYTLLFVLNGNVIQMLIKC